MFWFYSAEKRAVKGFDDNSFYGKSAVEGGKGNVAYTKSEGSVGNSFYSKSDVEGFDDNSFYANSAVEGESSAGNSFYSKSPVEDGKGNVAFKIPEGSDDNSFYPKLTLEA